MDKSRGGVKYCLITCSVLFMQSRQEIEGYFWLSSNEHDGRRRAFAGGITGKSAVGAVMEVCGSGFEV